jgi:integrase
MLETGMRPEEVFRIRREDVHLEHGYLFNPYGKTKAAKRKIPLTDKAAAVFAKRLKEEKGEYLFPGRWNKDVPIIKVNNAHTAALRRSGVRRFRLYDLRHTWATRAAMAGVDILTLAALLGHSRVQMVMRYAYPTEEHQFNAMKKVQTFVESSLIRKSEKGTTVTLSSNCGDFLVAVICEAKRVVGGGDRNRTDE